MMPVLFIMLAQMPDSLINPLLRDGVLGVIIAVLFWRDFKRDEKLERLASSLNYLTRALVIEVLSRPASVQRVHDEAREIRDAVTPRKE
jgi:hypothetical protein